MKKTKSKEFLYPIDRDWLMGDPGHNIGRLHIELVCLIDLKKGKFHWTGKSYPTPSQQMGLVRMSKL